MHQAPLTQQDIDATLSEGNREKTKTRQRIEKIKEDIATGQGVLPKVLGGAMIIPKAISNLKPREIPTKHVTL